MELLDYYNYSDKLNYDDKGFLINFDQIHKNVVYFNQKTENDKNFNSFEQSIFSFNLEYNDNEKYIYSISIIEEGNAFDFVALGKVEIYYKIINSNIRLLEQTLLPHK